MGKKRRKAEALGQPARPTLERRSVTEEESVVRARRWPYALAALAVLWAAFEAYGPALRGSFLFDDLYLPFTRPGLAEAGLRHWLGQIRPVLMLSYWINYRISELNPYSYHLFNLLAHYFTAVLVFLTARKILSWASYEGLRREILAGFVGGLFLLHPLQTESVAYVASRSEALSGMFFYAALTVFVYRRRKAISWAASGLVILLYGAAVLTKEHAAVLAGLLLLTDYFWNPGFSLAGIRQNWRLYLPLAAGAAVAFRFVWKVLAASDTAGFGVREFTWYEYFFTQCRGLWLYFRLFLLPYGQNLDYDFPISRTLWERGAWLGLLALVALVTAVWIWRRRYPLAAYGILAALVTLAPTSSFVPILDPVAERRMYLPLFGLALAAAELLGRWRTSPWRLTATICTLLAAAGFLTWRRNHVWSDAVALWEDTVAKSPAKQRPHFQLAYAYYERGRCREAVQQYARAAELGKPDYRLLVDWAMAHDCAGQAEEALAKLQQAAALERTAHVLALIGMIHGKQGRRAEALAALEQAAKLDPGFDMIYVYRGNVYFSAGEREAAAREYRRALEINPKNPAARQGLLQAEAARKGPA